MAQGCHLVFSGEDRGHFDYHCVPQRDESGTLRHLLDRMGIEPASFAQNLLTEGSGGRVINRTEAEEQGVTGTQFDTFEQRLQDMPPKDQQAVLNIMSSRAHAQVDWIAALGNSLLDESMALALPNAIDQILQQYPATLGLFEPARPRASAWVKHLKAAGGRDQADDCAYAVLETAAMARANIKSTLGTSLRVNDTDRLDFGLRHQAPYGNSSALWAEGLDFHQPLCATVEVDLLITRQLFFVPIEFIGVDFKHCNNDNSSHVDEEQLAGVLNSLEGGRVDQFHFVTNTRFDAATVAAVASANEWIDDHNKHAEGPPLAKIGLFEHCQWNA
jgi:hypothetical protein